MDKTYTIIPDFMLDFDLNLTETIALAVIYGFCQDGESDFHGSYSYLARKIKVERRSAMRIVERLIAKGLVEKQVQEVKGVKSCSFRTTFKGGDRMSPVVTQSHQGGDRMSPGGGDRMSPNNIDNKINRNKRESVFTPPTLDEVRAFWRERPSMTSDPDHFYLYFDEADWKYKGGRKMKDWHKAALMWEKNEKKYGR